MSRVRGAGAVGWEKGCREGQGGWRRHPPAAVPEVLALCSGDILWQEPHHRPCAAGTRRLCQAGGQTGGRTVLTGDEKSLGAPLIFFLQAWLYAPLRLLVYHTAALIWTLLLHLGFKPLSTRGYLQIQFLLPRTLEFCEPSAAIFLLLHFSPLPFFSGVISASLWPARFPQPFPPHRLPGAPRPSRSSSCRACGGAGGCGGEQLQPPGRQRFPLPACPGGDWLPSC